jgi:hypothetical protein
MLDQSLTVKERRGVVWFVLVILATAVVATLAVIGVAVNHLI